VPMDVNDMDSVDDVVFSSQETGFTKITMVADDRSREPSAGAVGSTAWEAAKTTEGHTVRAIGRLVSQTTFGNS
jgi:hypothetical protein